MSFRSKRSTTYTHVQGCHGNVIGSCPAGVGCGDINCNTCHDCKGQACTLDECKKLAEDNDADGFAYRRSGDQYCRLCTFSELTNYKSESDYGIYSRIPRMYLTLIWFIKNDVDYSGLEDK